MITLPVGIGVLLVTYFYTRQSKSTSSELPPFLVNHDNASALLSKGPAQDANGQRGSHPNYAD